MGTARAKSADVGTMFAIGTRIPYKRRDHDSGAPRTALYAANGMFWRASSATWLLTWQPLGVVASRRCILWSETPRGTRVCFRCRRWMVKLFRLRLIGLALKGRTTGADDTCEVAIALCEDATGNVADGSEVAGYLPVGRVPL